jgi:hypothetical protein
MGIGLYQAAIMAHTFGFELELSENEPGRVCFNLFQHKGGDAKKGKARPADQGS